jgi:ABC-type molybdate transport system permease subunit
MSDRPDPRKDPSLRPFIRSITIELLIYAPIVMVYLLLVLRYGSDTLLRLFQESTIVYTFVGTAAILAQVVLLDLLTTWLLRRFGLRR